LELKDDGSWVGGKGNEKRKKSKASDEKGEKEGEKDELDKPKKSKRKVSMKEGRKPKEGKERKEKAKESRKGKEKRNDKEKSSSKEKKSRTKSSESEKGLKKKKKQTVASLQKALMELDRFDECDDLSEDECPKNKRKLDEMLGSEHEKLLPNTMVTMTTPTSVYQPPPPAKKQKTKPNATESSLNNAASVPANNNIFIVDSLEEFDDNFNDGHYDNMITQFDADEADYPNIEDYEIQLVEDSFEEDPIEKVGNDEIGMNIESDPFPMNNIVENCEEFVDELLNDEELRRMFSTTGKQSDSEREKEIVVDASVIPLTFSSSTNNSNNYSNSNNSNNSGRIDRFPSFSSKRPIVIEISKPNAVEKEKCDEERARKPVAPICRGNSPIRAPMLPEKFDVGDVRSEIQEIPPRDQFTDEGRIS
jgi:hypothetical protein